MPVAEAFVDTNVLLYQISKEPQKAARAEMLLRNRPAISVQVLNEFANVASRKTGHSWPDIRNMLNILKGQLPVVPLTVDVHEQGLEIAELRRFSVYDSMLLAAALQAGCTTFWSEDLHDGQMIEGQITIRNPFTEGRRPNTPTPAPRP